MSKRPKSYNIPLPKCYRKLFKNTPENGMGYHRVSMVLNDGSEIRGALVNIEKILYQHTNELKTSDIKDIKPLNYEISK